MFRLRFKHEFSDNKLSYFIWLGTLLLLLITAYASWNDLTVNLWDALIHILVLAAPIAGLVHIHQVLGKDLYLKHTAFWNTRPIRGGTLFRTKWTFLQFSITLPVMIATAVITIMIRRPDQLIQGVIEYGTVSLIITSVITYSTVAIRGRQYLALGLFLAVGLGARSTINHTNEYGFNTEVNYTPHLVLIILTLGFAGLLFLTLKKRHVAPPLFLIPPLVFGFVGLVVFHPAVWKRDPQTVEPTMIETEIFAKDFRRSSRGAQQRITLHLPIDNKVIELDASKPIQVNEVNLDISGIPEELKDRIIIDRTQNYPLGISISFCDSTSIGRSGSSSSGTLPSDHPIFALKLASPIVIEGVITVSQDNYRAIIDSSVGETGHQFSEGLHFKIERPPLLLNAINVSLNQGNLTFWPLLPNTHTRPKIEIIDPTTGSSIKSGGQSNSNIRHWWGSATQTRMNFRKTQINDHTIVRFSKYVDSDHYQIPLKIKTMIPDAAKVFELLDK